MEPTALVFDIEKFAVHDGPGIRTVVFIKGCPLRCIWCHNPESWLAAPQLFYNQEKCLNCGNCIPACPVGCHRMDGMSHRFDRINCRSCGKCADFCPGEALELCGRERTAKDVFSEVLKDRPFYENSGGGMTLSGGEPMMHFEFTKALLKLAKENKIHTALETSGFAPLAQYQEILPLTDLFLFDIKTLDPEKHKKFTGQRNELILSNLHFLNENGANLILRCPLIPGLNDSEEELRAIGRLAEALKQVSAVHVEPYHPLGVSKSERLGGKALWNAPFAAPEFTRNCITYISKFTTKSVIKG